VRRVPTDKSIRNEGILYRNGRIGDVPEPLIGENDVLIEVHGSSVNPLDLKIRSGEFKMILPYQMPLILGNDVAGVVLSTGAAVKRFKPGDEVYARAPENRIGTFAERIAVDEQALALKPANLDMTEAASRQAAKGSESVDTRRLRWRRHGRHSTGQTHWRFRRDDY
jgi:NADPH:quinone reductase-like Zn-dependent oxidoreductase